MLACPDIGALIRLQLLCNIAEFKQIHSHVFYYKLYHCNGCSEPMMYFRVHIYWQLISVQTPVLIKY